MCLIARHLESVGIPTVCLASAFDITKAGRAPRTVFVDYPLGHTSGRPFDLGDQKRIVGSALDAFTEITTPGQIISLPCEWSDGHTWRAEAVDPSQGDVRQPRDTTPRYQYDSDRMLAEKRSAK